MSSTYKVPANPDDAGATKTQLRWVYCCFVDVVVLLDYSISTNVVGWFCSKKKYVLSCLIPSVGLLVFVCFLFCPQIRNFLFSSDEVVTAAQHLYEMVSFYFDDLGKPLFVC